MRCRNSWSFVLLFFLMACARVQTENQLANAVDDNVRTQTTVQGSASITEVGLARARQMAIDDAIGNASLQLKSGDSSKAMLVGDVKVVDEWQEGDTYQVQALVVLSGRKSCQGGYRKKIVATGFPFMNPDQVSGVESQDLSSGIPREISNRLMESGDFIARNMTGSSLYGSPELAPEIQNTGAYSNSMLLDVAKRNDAQLVLSGVIRDFKIESTEYARGTGLLAMLKSSMRDFIGRRSIGIDVFIHDGFTGALLFQHRYTDSILGDVTLPTGYNVGSERFESSSAGHKISGIIHEASDDIRQIFACHPFTARVTRVDNQRIFINAGAQDKLNPGDRFMVYSAASSDAMGMGFSEQIGMLVISDVGPGMAAGSLESESKTMVRPGDWVRSLSAR